MLWWTAIISLSHAKESSSLSWRGGLYARSSNYALYGDMSARVMSILADSVPKIEVYSIDEAFLVMDGIDGDRITGICRELAARIADFAAMCAEKLREEKTVAGKVTVFIWTNRFRDDLEQYYPSATICLPVAANNTQEIVAAAIRGMDIIYREAYRYKKAGVIVDDISDEGSVQPEIFGFDMEMRMRRDALSTVMDRINGNPALTGRRAESGIRLASQSRVRFSDGVKAGFRSVCFSISCPFRSSCLFADADNFSKKNLEIKKSFVSLQSNIAG